MCAIIEFFLNVFTDFSEISDKNNIILKRGLLCSNLLSLVQETSTLPQHNKLLVTKKIFDTNSCFSDFSDSPNSLNSLKVSFYLGEIPMFSAASVCNVALYECVCISLSSNFLSTKDNNFVQAEHLHSISVKFKIQCNLVKVKIIFHIHLAFTCLYKYSSEACFSGQCHVKVSLREGHVMVSLQKKKPDHFNCLSEGLVKNNISLIWTWRRLTSSWIVPIDVLY